MLNNSLFAGIIKNSDIIKFFITHLCLHKFTWSMCAKVHAKIINFPGIMVGGIRGESPKGPS